MSDNLKRKIETEEKLFNYVGEYQVISSHDMVELVKAKNIEPTKLISGFPTLDAYIDGFEEGEVTVISGETGHGKTLLALSLTDRFACEPANSLWFSYELTARQFLSKFGDRVPLFFIPKTLRARHLEWLRQRIWEAKAKYGIDAVFIDHLHYLIDMKFQNVSLEIGRAMRFLKQFAVEFRVAIFLIAHTTKVESSKEIGLSDIRDSSFIGQESDNVLCIWRRTDVENRATLKIAKNRRNGVFDKKIRLVKVGEYLKEFTDV